MSNFLLALKRFSYPVLHVLRVFEHRRIGLYWIGFMLVASFCYWLYWAFTHTPHTRLITPSQTSRNYWNIASHVLLDNRPHPTYYAEHVHHEMRFRRQGTIKLDRSVNMGHYVAYSGRYNFYVSRTNIALDSWMDRLGVNIYWVEHLREAAYEPGTIYIEEPSKGRIMMIFPKRHALTEIPQDMHWQKVTPEEQ